VFPVCVSRCPPFVWTISWTNRSVTSVPEGWNFLQYQTVITTCSKRTFRNLELSLQRTWNCSRSLCLDMLHVFVAGKVCLLINRTNGVVLLRSCCLDSVHEVLASLEATTARCNVQFNNRAFCLLHWQFCGYDGTSIDKLIALKMSSN